MSLRGLGEEDQTVSPAPAADCFTDSNSLDFEQPVTIPAQVCHQSPEGFSPCFPANPDGFRKHGWKRDLNPIWKPPRLKEFAVRNSLLADPDAMSKLRSSYNLAVVILILLAFKTLVYDIATRESINMGMGLLRSTFGGFHYAVAIWLLMKLAVMLQYVAFAHWSRARRRVPAGARRTSWDVLGLASVVLFDAAMLAVPALSVLLVDLPCASSFALLSEAVRLLMKSHAFVRSNAPRALRDGTTPPFARWLYFMFAPTLIYRDTYPRTNRVRWGVVAASLLEVAGCVLLLCLVFDGYLMPLFRRFGSVDSQALLAALAALAGCLLPSMLFLLSFFYLLLHSWQNAWAEMLRFDDRMFYKDWWNQTSFGSYYRTWNVLVQDWLHAYLYQEVIQIGGNKRSARMAVFFVSALVHEIIVGFSLRLVFPAVFISFGIIGYFVRPFTGGNLYLLLCIFFGNGTIIGLYCMEYFARENCTPLHDSAWDLVIPRSWNCVSLVLESKPSLDH